MDHDVIQAYLNELSEETRILIGPIRTISPPECPLQFHREYIQQSRPVIIKDLSKQWKASQRWNFDYFNKLISSNVVQVLPGLLFLFFYFFLDFGDSRWMGGCGWSEFGNFQTSRREKYEIL